MLLRHRAGSAGAGILCGVEAGFVGLEMTEPTFGPRVFV